MPEDPDLDRLGHLTFGVATVDEAIGCRSGDAGGELQHQSTKKVAAATCAQCTQETIQVYTDGGVDMGQRCWTAQATWGLYLKDGDPAAVEEALRGAAHTEEKDEGCIAYGQAMGPALSSTRAEAIGIYAALAIPGPLHIKLDNAGVVNRGNKLLPGKL